MSITPPAAPAPSPTNYVTDAVTKKGKEYLSIKSNGVAADTQISLSTGQPLGIVQGVQWSIGVGTGAVAKAVVTTMAAPGDLRALVEDTTITLLPAKGYPPFRYLWDYYRTKLDRVRAAQGFHPLRYLLDYYSTKVYLFFTPYPSKP